MNKEILIKKIQQIRGLTDECLRELSGSKTALIKPQKKTSHSPRVPQVSDIDFTKPIRPFIKLYSKGMSGPKKFSLLLAYLVKGDTKKEVSLEEIEKQWNRMTSPSLLGMEFNRFYSGQAKDNDWVDSKKTGVYYLRPSWKEILS